MTLERLIQFFADLLGKKFTGRIMLDVHEGHISHRIKKEIVEIVE